MFKFIVFLFYFVGFPKTFWKKEIVVFAVQDKEWCLCRYLYVCCWTTHPSYRFDLLKRICIEIWMTFFIILISLHFLPRCKIYGRPGHCSRFFPANKFWSKKRKLKKTNHISLPVSEPTLCGVIKILLN